MLFQTAAFNELDKLPSLTHLTITVDPKMGFEDTYANAIAHMSQLAVLNKKTISPPERRGAEYDIWKRHSAEWMQTKDNAVERCAFLEKHRAYALIVDSKYREPTSQVRRPPSRAKNILPGNSMFVDGVFAFWYSKLKATHVLRLI